MPVRSVQVFIFLACTIIGYFALNVLIAKKPTCTIIVANLLFALLLNLGMKVATSGQASSPYSGQDMLQKLSYNNQVSSHNRVLVTDIHCMSWL